MRGSLRSLGGLDFAVDHDGTGRPQGDGWDAGAYEFAGADAVAPAAPSGLTVQ